MHPRQSAEQLATHLGSEREIAAQGGTQVLQVGARRGNDHFSVGVQARPVERSHQFLHRREDARCTCSLGQAEQAEQASLGEAALTCT